MRTLKILVRKNLNMSRNKTAAQAVHAAGIHDRVIVLEVSDAKFNETLKEHPEAYVVTDAGRTEVEPGTDTALSYWEEQ